MTDNEIIKALECCGEDSDCKHCPYYVNERYTCGEFFNKDVLDLINRQKAEIERLQNDVGKEFTCFVGEPHKVEHCPYLEELETATVEAVKEFAEKLKEYVESYDVTTGYKIIIVNAVEEETIDNLVKELVGGG